MHSYAILGLASLASLASAAIVPGGSQFFPANGLARRNETVTTTKVVEAYTTYCPEPTTFELGGKTYTVEEPTTLTITECPCTIVEVRFLFCQVCEMMMLTMMLTALLHLCPCSHWHWYSSRSFSSQPRSSWPSWPSRSPRHDFHPRGGARPSAHDRCRRRWKERSGPRRCRCVRFARSVRDLAERSVVLFSRQGFLL